MHTLFFPAELTEDIMRLSAGEVINTVANLDALSKRATPSNYSLQAIASSDVRVDVFMSNLMSTDPDSPMWMPCPSIPSFTIHAGENLFFQNAFDVTCGYLLVRFTALETDPNITTACSMRLCMDSRIIKT